MCIRDRFRTPPSSVGAVEAAPPRLIISPGSAILCSYKIYPRARHSVITIAIIVTTKIIMMVISVRWVRSVTIIVGIWISLTVWDIIILLIKIVSIVWIGVVIPDAVKITVKLVITRRVVRAVVIIGLVPVTCMAVSYTHLDVYKRQVIFIKITNNFASVFCHYVITLG